MLSKIIKTLTISIILIGLLGNFNHIDAETLPKFNGNVNDYYNLLTKNQKDNLNKLINETRNKTGHQIIILIIDTINDMSIEDYSQKIIDKWEKKEKNTNIDLLFVFAMNDKKLRIEVGSKLVKVLTNEICTGIVDSIIPYFKEGDYYQGINESLSQVSKILKKKE
jgi:uncharacterized protein